MNEWLSDRGVTRGGKGARFPGVVSLRGAPKSPNNVTSTSFKTEHLLPKDLRFEHGGTEPASCPGRHLTSLRPCCQSMLNSNARVRTRNPLLWGHLISTCVYSFCCCSGAHRRSGRFQRRSRKVRQSVRTRPQLHFDLARASQCDQGGRATHFDRLFSNIARRRRVQAAARLGRRCGIHHRESKFGSGVVSCSVLLSCP